MAFRSPDPLGGDLAIPRNTDRVLTCLRDQESFRSSQTRLEILSNETREKFRTLLLKSKNPQKSLENLRTKIQSFIAKSTPVSFDQPALVPSHQIATPNQRSIKEEVPQDPQLTRSDGGRQLILKRKSIAFRRRLEGMRTMRTSCCQMANEPDVEKDYKGKTVVQSLGDGMPKKKEHPAAWTKPDEGWQKLNVDASFSIEENKGTWGAVLRDHEGKVLVTAWGLINHCLNAEMAEGIAVLEGVKSIIALASTHVVVECDNANVIKELKLKDRSNSQLAFVISDTKDLLSLLPGYKVQKVNRAGNFVAHDIASFCKNVGYGGVLLDSFPSCVLERVNMDCKGYCIVDSSG